MKPNRIRSAMWTSALIVGTAFAWLAAGAALSKSTAEMKTVGQIRQLSRETAALGYPVHLSAVATYVDAVGPNLFVQDATGGTWVDMRGTTSMPRPGQLLDLRGTVASGFTPYIGNPSWKALSEPGMPRPRRLSYSEMASGSFDSWWVETDGIVRSFVLEAEGDVLVIDVAAATGGFKARLPGFRGSFPMELVDANVRFHGVCGASFNQRKQLVSIHLFVPGMEHVKIIEPAPKDPFSIPVRPISEVARFSSKGPEVHRIKVIGIVTAWTPGTGMYVKDSSGGLYVQTTDGSPVHPGSEVEVIGFPAVGEYTPILKSGRVRPTGQQRPLAAQRVTAREALRGTFDAELVQISATLLGIRPGTGNASTLVLESENISYEATIPLPSNAPELARLQSSSKLGLTGICSIKIDENGNPAAFRIILRSPPDIVVLESPPWLSANRIIEIGTFVIIIAGFAWVFSLRRQIKREAALAQRLEHVIRATNDFVWERNLTSYMCWWSESFRADFGLRPDEDQADSEWWADRIHPEDRLAVVSSIKLSIKGTDSRWSSEYRFRKTDGSYAFVCDRGYIIRDKKGLPLRMIGAMMDITERKRAESELMEANRKLQSEIADRIKAENELKAKEDEFIQAQKMEAIGVLAGGIAHDFNNMLTVVNGYSDLILKRMPEDDPLREEMIEVSQAGQKASMFITQLLAFSRKQMLQTKILRLDEIVADTGKILRRLIGEDIDLVLIARPGLGLINADPVQIQQIIMNLAVNARDAMPGGGKLIIETSNLDLDEDNAGDYPMMPPGEYVELTVSDNGIGMDAATQSRIFEPFFTTKVMGKGSGLGLSTVYGIVKQSNGYIQVKSAPGEGTIFQVFLPRLVEDVDIPSWEEIDELELRGVETLLVVEDDDGVRGLMVKGLVERGYSVIDASSGEEALLKAAACPKPIHLVITDVIMPGMNGRAFADQIRTARPATKVLYVSGYATEVLTRNSVLDSSMEFLKKPFTAAELARKVRDVIDPVMRNI